MKIQYTVTISHPYPKVWEWRITADQHPQTDLGGYAKTKLDAVNDAHVILLDLTKNLESKKLEEDDWYLVTIETGIKLVKSRSNINAMIKLGCHPKNEVKVPIVDGTIRLKATLMGIEIIEEPILQN
jgi:hypothetical protein